MFGRAAAPRDALVSRLGFSECPEAASGIGDGPEVVIYRRSIETQKAVLSGRDEGPERVPSKVFWPYSNWVQYTWLIGGPVLGLCVITLLSVSVLAMPGDSLADYLIPQLVLLPFWCMVLWQTLQAVNTAVVFTDTCLIRHSWLRTRRRIPWNTITAVVWRPQKSGLGWRMHNVLELELSEPSGGIRIVKIAGGVAGEGSARRIRDAVISIRGFPIVPANRDVVFGGQGEEIVWREY